MMVALIAFKSHAARVEFNERFAMQLGMTATEAQDDGWVTLSWTEIFRGDVADRAADVANKVAGAVIVKYAEEG